MRKWRLLDQPLAIQFLAAGTVVAALSFISVFIVLGLMARQTRVAHEMVQAAAVHELEINYPEQFRAFVTGEEKQQALFRSAFVVMLVITVALLVVFGIILTQLYFSIARPITELSRCIERYQSGEFDVRVLVTNRSQIGFLESTFNEMAEKIEGMVRDLRKLDEMKTDFISTVTHELRTPLTSIAGYLKLFLSGDAGPVSETGQEFLNIIHINVERLTHLISDILDVEKMDSGKVQIVKEPLNLVEILEECRNSFALVAKQKGLEFAYNVPLSNVTIVGDRTRLFQIFSNLISNAIKYTHEGQVEIRAEIRDYAVLVKVIDTGMGMKAEEQELLFQKFYRTKSGLASSEGGTGLGLSIAQGLVEAHGGTINVESAPGEGTAFTVALPVKTTGARTGSRHDKISGAPTGSRRDPI